MYKFSQLCFRLVYVDACSKAHKTLLIELYLFIGGLKEACFHYPSSK